MHGARLVLTLTASAVVGHWSAGYSERRTSGAGRGRRKRAGDSTSPAAYSTSSSVSSAHGPMQKRSWPRSKGLCETP